MTAVLLRKKDIALFLLCFYFISGYAQGNKPIWFHALKKDFGLPSNSIFTYFRDSHGFIWMASSGGLCRFDGSSIKYYYAEKDNPKAIDNDAIFGSLFEDRNKDIWFSSNQSILRYNQSSDDFSRFYLKDEYGDVIHNNYQAIFLEKDSFLWLLAGDKELFRYDIYSDRNTPPMDSVKFDIDVFPGYDEESRFLKYLFVVDGSKSPGLEVLSFDEKSTLLNHEFYFDGHDPRFPKLNIHTVYYENDTAVWLAANPGLFRYDLIHKKLESFSTGVESPKKITPYGESRFILSDFKNGLFWFNKGSGKFTKLFAGLVDDPDTDLNVMLKHPYYDNSGTLWIEYNDAGCVFASLNKSKFKSLPKTNLFDGSKNYEYRNLVVDKDGRIWCGTFDDGIFLLDKYGRVTRSFHLDLEGNDHLIDKEIYSLLIDKNENTWIGTANGLAILQDGKSGFQEVLNEKNTQVKSIAFLCQLRNGDILASSLRDGVFRIEKSGSKFYVKQILATTNDSDFFTYIYESEFGEIYILNNYTELLVFNYKEKKLHRVARFSTPGLVNGFYEDINHKTLWIASEGGLVKIDKTDLIADPVVFTERNGLKSKHIRSFLPDKEGNLWMGTSSGLSKFIVSEERFINFTLADGIQSTQFDAFAALKYSDNTLWFGGNNGITIVEPDQIHFLQEPPVIQLTDVRINDLPPEDLRDEVTGTTNWTELKTIHLPFDDNTLSLGFVAIDYSDPTSTQLKYKMEGIDEDWVLLEKGAPGFARYPKMPEGSYTFQVLGANSDGVWGKDPYQLRITIDPPYWRTLWFRSLTGMGALLLVLLGIFLWMLRVREREQLNTRVAENKLAALRAQMNPHFIFNSLNSINGYILGKKTTEASNYLVRFSRLMRMILDFSRQPFIALEEEIELIRLYLEVEGMRLKVPFSFDIRVGEELDPFEVQVPTMVIQPFVENAIVHGLASKTEGEGRIEVVFSQENNQCLKCTIRDNGIGRRKAADIQAQKGRKHQSHALEINRERLALLSRGSKKTFNFSIEDLTDTDGTPAGTKVTMLLPFH